MVVLYLVYKLTVTEKKKNRVVSNFLETVLMEQE